ncbi:protein-methionine-sulfoxide reductase heme-binding subunit MsrQ [Pseudosulfitobacter pseudonitzschiae]|uniref:protein-methionine-sulfoxide reductase heme-binding subunit MsrQ n=1 Tax=Pseudosulfitobacter pseudonitzschiae TaxID=1402135 RepID=UPI003B77A3BF
MACIIDRLNGIIRTMPTWIVYLLFSLPVPWLFYQGQTGGLGPEPINSLEAELGKISLQLLIAGLTITPLRRYAGLNLMKFRRAFGLLAFFYVTIHLLVWLLLDVGILSQIWEDILKRPYITIGMAGFLCLLPLAMTSNNMSVRRLGARWKQLHKLTYIAVLLGAVHFIWLVKGFQLEPLIYMAIIGILLAVRIPVHRMKIAR